MYWAPTVIGLIHVRCITMVIRFPSVHHVLTAIGVFPVHSKVGACLLLIVPFSVSTDVELILRWIDRFFDDLSCVKVDKRELGASHNSIVVALLTMRRVS